MVVCVCLTADRNQFVNRALACFMDQTYERKSLLVFDNGKYRALVESHDPEVIVARAEQFRGASIGALRNAANELCRGTDIIAHWDSDDWSHPYRLAEQVNFLQASQADCVGYNNMLMWTHGATHLYRYDGPRAVNTYALETSLLYWRRSWERLKFHDSNLGDHHWVKQVRCVSVASFLVDRTSVVVYASEPRMIAEIHDGNTVMRPDMLPSHNFTRVPEWDAFCRDRMKL